MEFGTGAPEGRAADLMAEQSEEPAAHEKDSRDSAAGSSSIPKIPEGRIVRGTKREVPLLVRSI